MNAKKSKKVLLLASLSTLAVSTAAVMAISFSNESARVRGLGEVVNGSITWSTSSTKSGSGRELSWKSSTASGTEMYLYSYGQYNPFSYEIFDSKKNDAGDYGVFVKSAAGKDGAMFQFQSITSVTIVSCNSQADASYAIFTDSTASGSPVASQTLEYRMSSAEETHTFTSEVAGARYLAIKPTNASYYFGIKSITVTYSCEPGGPSEYNIRKSEDVGYSISASKSSAAAGENVSFSVEVATGYTLNSVSVKKGSEDVTVTGPVAGQYSFIMPAGEVEISASMSGLHHIAFGYGYKTNYLVGESFEKPLVYAYNYGDTTGTEVTSSATASGYNMAVAGEYTVTVSYTDSLSATVTKDYTITVSASSEHSISFAGFDYNIEEEVDVSEFLEDSSVLPTSCAAGDTVTFTLVFKESFQYDFYGPFFQHDPEGSGFYLISSYDSWPNTTWTVEMPDRDVVIMLGYL